MQSTRLAYLFERYLAKTYTPEEKQELATIVLDAGNNEMIHELLEKAWHVTANDMDLEDVKADIMLHSILTLSPLQGRIESLPVVSGAKIRKLWRLVAVACAVLLTVGLGKYFLQDNKIARQAGIIRAALPDELAAPKSTKAMITIANGKTVALDSIANGTLAIEEDVHVVKLADGQIVYYGSAKEEVYNTLTNPRGSGVVNMTLADGSMVWLNAGSSITFPVSFAGKDGKVSITGEAYFEVVHNARMPFKVMKGETEIKVLGTHFNVNTYDDEESMKVTLLQGSVKITRQNAVRILKPGDQALLSNEITVANAVDTAVVMAWKNGKFQFGDKADINAIMREISRWYDLNVQYEGNPDCHIGGAIPRTVNASTVLKMLEVTGSVKFKIEGKKVTVIPVSL